MDVYRGEEGRKGKYSKIVTSGCLNKEYECPLYFRYAFMKVFKIFQNKFGENFKFKNKITFIMSHCFRCLNPVCYPLSTSLADWKKVTHSRWGIITWDFWSARMKAIRMQV